MAPTIVLKDHKPVLVIGTPGGPRIPAAMVEVVLAVLEFDVPLHDALDLPRFFPAGTYLVYETRLPQATVDTLAAKGWKPYPNEPLSNYFGGVQAIHFSENGQRLVGSSDREETEQQTVIKANMSRRVYYILLMFATCGLVSSQAIFAANETSVYDHMLAAAQHMQRAERQIYLSKQSLGLVNEKDDVNRTGLVGDEYTPLTTTVGVLSAKRSSTNPDFAAYLTKLLLEQKLSRNDTVLVTMTGSFPGMNLALLCALEELKIPSLRIASLGSSSYGANQLDMTWIDMEDILVREGLLSRRSDYVTLGGTGDIGGGLEDETIEFLRRKCARLGFALIESGNKRAQYEERLSLFGDPNDYALLINAGGNHLMLGTGPEGRELPGGFIKPESSTWQGDVSSTSGGLVFDFLYSGIPVLNLLHVEDIATRAGIPFDPSPLPRLGTSAVYQVSIRDRRDCVADHGGGPVRGNFSRAHTDRSFARSISACGKFGIWQWRGDALHI
jgi:poly-gamma-glutamate system protein